METNRQNRNTNSSLEGPIKSRNTAKLEERLEKSESAIDKSFAENIAGYIAKHGMRDDTMALDVDSRTNTVYPIYSGNIRSKEDPDAIYTFSTSLRINNKHILMYLESGCKILNGVPAEYKLEVSRETNEMSTSPYWSGNSYEKVLTYSKTRGSDSLEIVNGDWRKSLENKLFALNSKKQE